MEVTKMIDADINFWISYIAKHGQDENFSYGQHIDAISIKQKKYLKSALLCSKELLDRTADKGYFSSHYPYPRVQLQGMFR